jgi:hypothetical protein
VELALVDARGNIHELEEARKRLTEQELAALVPIPDDELERVQAMSIDERIVWYEERLAEEAERALAAKPAGPISRDNLGETAPPLEEWPKWRKTSITSAIRIIGPFVVATSEGR